MGNCRTNDLVSSTKCKEKKTEETYKLRGLKEYQSTTMCGTWIDQKQVTFTWDRQEYTFVVLSQGHVNSFAPCHNIVQIVVDHLDIPQNIKGTRDIDDIIVTRRMSKRWLARWRL